MTGSAEWRITFFSEKVEKQTLALPAGILASFLRIAELIEEFGPDIGRPHTAQLGEGLFEIRASGREGIARVLCCALKNREVVVLLSIVKKQNRLPKRHMDTARRRVNEVMKSE